MCVCVCVVKGAVSAPVPLSRRDTLWFTGHSMSWRWPTLILLLSKKVPVLRLRRMLMGYRRPWLSRAARSEKETTLQRKEAALGSSAYLPRQATVDAFDTALGIAPGTSVKGTR